MTAQQRDSAHTLVLLSGLPHCNRGHWGAVLGAVRKRPLLSGPPSYIILFRKVNFTGIISVCNVIVHVFNIRKSYVSLYNYRVYTEYVHIFIYSHKLPSPIQILSLNHIYYPETIFCRDG